MAKNEMLSFNDLSKPDQLTLSLEILDENIRHRELTRLTTMPVVPFADLKLAPLEEDLIANVRLYKLTELVYSKGESVTDKLATVFNTLQTYRASVFLILDADGKKTDFYLGVRSNGDARSTVTIADTLKNTLIGHFPGIKLDSENRNQIKALSERLATQQNVTSVSVVGNLKNKQPQNNTEFVQGLEKLALALQGRQFTGMILAQNSGVGEISNLRDTLQSEYTQLSPFQKYQFSASQTSGSSRQQSFQEMSGAQRAALIGGSLSGIAGSALGAAAGWMAGAPAASGMGLMYGAQIGGMLAGSVGGLISAVAPIETLNDSKTDTVTRTTENKSITDMLQLIDTQIKRTQEFDSYGMWQVAAYFSSNDMAAAEIAASNYRSLMNGEESGRDVSAINSWRQGTAGFDNLSRTLARFVHPNFIYAQMANNQAWTTAALAVSGKALGLHLGLPRQTVPGLPVIEHAEFGKEVDSYQINSDREGADPKNRLNLGHIFDLGQITTKPVELNNRSLNMHTFITGSTGSGKSNTVYQILNELHQDDIPFLVVEPAKGEYKDVFGNWPDVRVFSTNPSVAPLINLNPFMFPDSIHVLEHIDGLVELFSVCWPMYDAMPAFFKKAILMAYEAVGWDLVSSTYEGDEVTYPSFETLVTQLQILIGQADYSDEVKGNYKGALITRVESLTVGLNKFIFTQKQTPYEQLFDQNCILDISRVKSGETKALIMGLMVYLLNEYRMDQKTSSDQQLRHITVLEEAHNLLRNTNGGNQSELVGKSVEMLTNTIAEIRTYGEGFVIVDQSPSSVDIAAIKNTNTKIVLRTPEANDREAVGRSMGLTPDQVNEIAKLPKGVAVVYQNDWLTPVLAKIAKAAVKQTPYVNNNPTVIRPARQARTDLILAILEPWLPRQEIPFSQLAQDLNSLSVSGPQRALLSAMLVAYRDANGHSVWSREAVPAVQAAIMAVLDLTEQSYQDLLSAGVPDVFTRFIAERTRNLSEEDCNVVGWFLTLEEE